MGWVVVGVIILIAVSSAVMQVLKNQQEPPARARPAARPQGNVKTGAGDIDRFLAELDKLRQKQTDSGGAPPPPKPAVVVARPKQQSKPPVAKPAKRQRVDAPTVARPVSRVDTLPPAVVDPPPLPPPPTRPMVTRRAVPVPTTQLGQDLAALLASGNAVPMAIVLHEIFGPPKCKR